MPGHLFVWGVTSLLHWPLVTAVQVQLFSIAYLTALIFVVLLSHEFIRSPVARLLPPLVFTLGVSANQFFMLAQHGPALAPTLAYLFGLVYFWRRRTPSSFFVFLLFLSCFVASINYITFSSHLFPLVLFTIFLAALSPDFLGSAWAALRAAMATVRGRAMIALGTLSCILAFVNIELTLYYFADEVVRVGDNLKDFSYDSKGLAGLATPPNWGIAPQRVFLAFNQWFPFDDAYRFALRDEPWQDLFIPRIDMRYIGIVTLPLLISAMAFGRRTGLMTPLVATYFLCTFVLPYTYWLEPFQYLFDHVPMLRNIRAMANTMPRDIPAVLAALLAGMGFDAFLAERRASPAISAFVPICALVITLCAGILALVPVFLPMRHSLAHIAAYLGISSLILLALLRSKQPINRHAACRAPVDHHLCRPRRLVLALLAKGRVDVAETAHDATSRSNAIWPDQERVRQLVRKLQRTCAWNRAELCVWAALMARPGEPRAVASGARKLESAHWQNDGISGAEVLQFRDLCAI